MAGKVLYATNFGRSFAPPNPRPVVAPEEEPASPAFNPPEEFASNTPHRRTVTARTIVGSLGSSEATRMGATGAGTTTAFSPSSSTYDYGALPTEGDQMSVAPNMSTQAGPAYGDYTAPASAAASYGGTPPPAYPEMVPYQPVPSKAGPLDRLLFPARVRAEEAASANMRAQSENEYREKKYRAQVETWKAQNPNLTGDEGLYMAELRGLVPKGTYANKVAIDAQLRAGAGKREMTLEEERARERALLEDKLTIEKKFGTGPFKPPTGDTTPFSKGDSYTDKQGRTWTSRFDQRTGKTVWEEVRIPTGEGLVSGGSNKGRVLEPEAFRPNMSKPQFETNLEKIGTDREPTPPKTKPESTSGRKQYATSSYEEWRRQFAASMGREPTEKEAGRAQAKGHFPPR